MAAQDSCPIYQRRVDSSSRPDTAPPPLRPCLQNCLITLLVKTSGTVQKWSVVCLRNASENAERYVRYPSSSNNNVSGRVEREVEDLLFRSTEVRCEGRSTMKLSRPTQAWKIVTGRDDTSGGNHIPRAEGVFQFFLEGIHRRVPNPITSGLTKT